jgi:hypothetical protein
MHATDQPSTKCNKTLFIHKCNTGALTGKKHVNWNTSEFYKNSHSKQFEAFKGIFRTELSVTTDTFNELC